MKKIEMIDKWTYGYREYQTDSIDDGFTKTIILRDVALHPYGVISYVKYNNTGFEYLSKWMSWNNLFRCSRYHGSVAKVTANGDSNFEKGAWYYPDTSIQIVYNSSVS